MSSLKALRDAGRFVGKEDTVPLRLLYSRHNHSQIAQDELSTRVKASSGSAQVHGVWRDGWRERGVCVRPVGCLQETPLCFLPVYVCIDAPSVLRGEINN